MSKVRVAIREDAASFRRGLEDALVSAGFVVEEPDDIVAWSHRSGNRLIVMTLGDPGACDLLDEVTADGHTAVALLPDPTADELAHAIGHGAMSAVAWNADPDEIVAVVAAAARGQALLPSVAVRTLAARGYHRHAPLITVAEMEWLLALSSGTTVVELANTAGYSERSMFRRLHELYTRLGVQNRASAVREAQRLGLLEVGA